MRATSREIESSITNSRCTGIFQQFRRLCASRMKVSFSTNEKLCRFWTNDTSTGKDQSNSLAYFTENKTTIYFFEKEDGSMLFTWTPINVIDVPASPIARLLIYHSKSFDSMSWGVKTNTVRNQRVSRYLNVLLMRTYCRVISFERYRLNLQLVATPVTSRSFQACVSWLTFRPRLRRKLKTRLNDYWCNVNRTRSHGNWINVCQCRVVRVHSRPSVASNKTDNSRRNRKESTDNDPFS